MAVPNARAWLGGRAAVLVAGRAAAPSRPRLARWPRPRARGWLGRRAPEPMAGWAAASPHLRLARWPRPHDRFWEPGQPSMGRTGARWPCAGRAGCRLRPWRLVVLSCLVRSHDVHIARARLQDDSGSTCVLMLSCMCMCLFMNKRVPG